MARRGAARPGENTAGQALQGMANKHFFGGTNERLHVDGRLSVGQRRTPER